MLTSSASFNESTQRTTYNPVLFIYTFSPNQYLEMQGGEKAQHIHFKRSDPVTANIRAEFSNHKEH